MDPGQILCVAPSPPYLKTILSFFFQIFNFNFFYDFFFVFVNMGPYGSKIFKTLLLLHFFIQSEPNFMVNKAVMGEYKVMEEKFCGTLKFLLTQDYMGLEISKRYSSYSFYPIWAKLYDKWGSHKGSQWENSKMCNILKKTDHRAKRMKKMGLTLLCTAYVRYFSCLILWVQFGVIRCTLQNFQC